MFICEKCGSRYNAAYAVAIESCPRCEAHGVVVPLAFSPFGRFEKRPGRFEKRPISRFRTTPTSDRSDRTQSSALPTR